MPSPPRPAAGSGLPAPDPRRPSPAPDPELASADAQLLRPRVAWIRLPRAPCDSSPPGSAAAASLCLQRGPSGLCSARRTPPRAVSSELCSDPAAGLFPAAGLCSRRLSFLPFRRPQSEQSTDASGGSGSSDNLVLQAPQPMREDYIQNAVKFLAHPKVKGSPVFYRRSFLEKKGLSKEEIDESFRRVPDPQTNSTDAAAVGSQHASNPDQSAGVQPYTADQSPQAVTGSITAGHIVPHTQPQFSLFHTLLGVGAFLGFGASAAVILKKLFLPGLKSWTRRVVAEGDESADNELKSKLYEEIREAMKASTSAFSAVAKTNQELLASKDEDKKILIKLTQAFDSQVEVLKSLSESLHHIPENWFSQYNLSKEHVQPAPWNGPSNNSWRASQQTNVYTTSPNSDFESGRHSFTPLPAEPTPGSFSRSYVEQRVQRPGYGFQPQMTNDRSNPGTRDSYYGSPYHHGGNAIDAPAAVAEESPFQRRWVPPQPPGVILPEAAAAIRQPRSLPRQQPQSGDVPGSSESVNEQMDGGVSGASELPSGGGTMANAGSSVTEERP